MEIPGTAELQLGSASAPGTAELQLGSASAPGAAELQLGSASAPGTAELQLGSASHRGFYSRGYLPHVDYPGALQTITYRLADSLPAAVLESLEAELRELPAGPTEAVRRRRLEVLLDGGLGSCVLRQPAAAECVVTGWRHFAGRRYDLIAWVVMPNHVHVVIRLYAGVPLAKIVQSWKSFTGRRIAELELGGPRLPGKAEMELGGPRLPGKAELELGGPRLPGKAELELGGPRPGKAELELGGPRPGIWMRDYWDRFIRDENHFWRAVTYVHENPVKAGLVARAELWPWSSAADFPLASHRR